jgi:hypothetical protein
MHATVTTPAAYITCFDLDISWGGRGEARHHVTGRNLTIAAIWTVDSERGVCDYRNKKLLTRVVIT